MVKPIKTPKQRPLTLPGAEINSWETSSDLEWIVTNGIGGYASGTLAGANTRRYHGFLMAALSPPVGRTLLVAKLGETISFDGQSFSLSCDEWWDGSVSSRGFQCLEGFELEDGLPVFRYRAGPYVLEKRVWMEHGENLTWASYHWPADAPPAQISIKVFAGYRDFHWSQHGSSDWRWHTQAAPDGFSLSPGSSEQRITLKISSLTGFKPENVWYWGFLHCRERERGLDDVEDLWVPGTLDSMLVPGCALGLLACAGDTRRAAGEAAAALERERARRTLRVDGLRFSSKEPEAASLAAAADMFLVSRPLHGRSLPKDANTVVAGYHWFGDWGRDTMISMPGLAITTGRLSEARDILLAYSAFVSEGMLPNRSPESGEEPEYNTVDATLWYFQAIHHYVEAAKDQELLAALYPCLKEIIRWHFQGTRHGIRVDPDDGLLRAGAPGLQLTWMDARVGDWVVTPRIGKPVEIAALWYNALRLMAEWAERCIDPGQQYAAQAARAAEAFGRRFWIEDAGYLYDVIDTPDGDDRSFRPNQLFALSLPFPLLPVERARSIVDACESRLLTPCGLRSLDPADPRYVGNYNGDQRHRDGAYHQGTVWGWLIGPYVDALLYAYNDLERARKAVTPVLKQLRQAGIGSISEIFDGDAPHAPQGCIAQAWSVAELLRVIEVLA